MGFKHHQTRQSHSNEVKLYSNAWFSSNVPEVVEGCARQYCFGTWAGCLGGREAGHAGVWTEHFVRRSRNDY